MHAALSADVMTMDSFFPSRSDQPLPNQSGRLSYRRGHMPGLWSKANGRLGPNLVWREGRQPADSVEKVGSDFHGRKVRA